MKIIALVIKQYNNLFNNQIFNFSDEYKVDFNIETNELKIDENPDYIENFYGESIYNISPIVGINGTGKTTVLNIISDYTPDKFEPNPDNQYFFLFELGKDKDKVRFKISSTNLSIATLLECVGSMEQTFYRNRDGSFECKQGHYGGTQNFLYVNLQKQGGGKINSLTTLNQKGLAMFIHSYLWLRDRKIISSLLFCSLYVEDYGLKENRNSIPEKINAIGFLIYKLIHNIFYEENEFIKKELTTSILTECKDFIKKVDYDYENNGLNLLKKIVDELDNNRLENKNRKFIKEYVESIINIVYSFKKLREKGSLIDNESSSILLKYSENNRKLFEELGDRLFKFMMTNDLINDLSHEINKNYYNYYLLVGTPNYHMSTGEGNLIEIFSQLLTYISVYKNSSENIILLVDELETGMHLEWSRRLIGILVNNLSEILKNKGKGRKIQIIFTTHSPYMLSDIKPGNVIMIEKNQKTGYSEGKILQNTFAKNIQEIMKENLIDNIYGDFALTKIDSMISRLNREEVQGENEEELLKEIHLISETILRTKLLEMYDKKYNTSEYSIEKQLLKLKLTGEQRQKVKEMIIANIKDADLSV